MDKLSVIGKMGDILSDLREQQAFFEKNHDALNDIEVELFSASASYLAEYARVLKMLSAAESKAKPGTLRQESESPFQEKMEKKLTPEAPEAVKDPVAKEESGRPAGTDASSPAAAEPDISTTSAPAASSPAAPTGSASTAPAASTPASPTAQATASPAEPASDEGSPADSKTASTDSAEPKDPIGEALAQSRIPSGTASSSETSARTEPSAASPVPSSASNDSPSASSPAVEQGKSPSAAAEQVKESASAPSTSSPASTGSSAVPPAASTPSSPMSDEARGTVSLNDRLGENKSRLHERIAPKKEEDSPAGAPIMNLGRSIGINERYYFIKNLFQDDKVAFDQAITRIDMCNSLGEALQYVDRSLSGKYSWKRKEEDARKFYDLLKRRFV